MGCKESNGGYDTSIEFDKAVHSSNVGGIPGVECCRPELEKYEKSFKDMGESF